MTYYYNPDLDNRYYSCEETECLDVIASVFDKKGENEVRLFKLGALPTESILSVRCLEQQVSYTISTISGQRILFGELVKGWNEIPLPQLSRGIFLLTAYTNRHIQTEKVIKR